jgi:uncharacterized protein (DUF58 family)
VIPSRLLVWLMVVPLGLAVVTLVDPTMVWTMLAVDLGIGLVAGLDAVAARRPLVTLGAELPGVLSLNRPQRVTVSLRSSSRRRLSVELTADLFEHASASDLPARLELPSGGYAEAVFHVTPHRRGAYGVGPYYVRYPSPLGLWARQLRLGTSAPVRVYPDLAHLRTFELLARRDRDHALVHAVRLKGGESEFERLRDYARDDEYRSVDWKATARRQKLTSREYQQERNQNLLFMLDAGRQMMGEVGGLTLFDHALNSMLMLAQLATRNGDRVGLVGFDDSVRAFVTPSGGRSAVRRLIQASYDLHPRLVEPDFDRAFEQVALRVKRRSLLVLLTQVRDGATRDRIIRRLRGAARRHLPLVVVFRDSDVEELLLPGQGDALELYTRGAAAEFLRWRDSFIVELRRAGAHVLEAAGGGLLAPLINSYLAIKARQLL